MLRKTRTGFFWKEKNIQSFSQSILPKAQAICIVLDVSKRADLSWKKEMHESFQLVQQGLLLVFRLLLDPIDDAVHHQAQQDFALEKAAEWIDLHFAEHTIGVILQTLDEYSILQLKNLSFSFRLEQMASFFSNYTIFMEYQVNRDELIGYLPLIFTRPMHTYIPLFTQPLPLQAFYYQYNMYKTPNLSFSKCAVLVQKEYVMPKQLISLFKKIQNKDQWIDCVEACNFSEHWQELDFVICDKILIDENIKRQLLGFAAAGGNVIFLDEPLGIEGEQPLTSFMQYTFVLQ